MGWRVRYEDKIGRLVPAANPRQCETSFHFLRFFPVMIVVALETARLSRGRTSTMAFLAILNAGQQNVRCFLAGLGARVTCGTRQ
jgi:hypothetical protein